jgi:galactonate dehydratase
MRVERIESLVVGNPWKNWVFARVHADGLVGVGEGSVNGFGATVAAAIDELAPLVVGHDAGRIEWLTRRMIRDYYTDGGQIHRAAVAAIEIALWDLLGKSVNRPVWMLLGGGVRDRIRAYANGWYRTERDPEAIGRAAVAACKKGYTALKLDPFGRAWRVMETRDRALSIDIVAAVRDAVGPDVDVLVEGHSRFSVDEAVEIARRLEPYAPMWFEEPVRHDRVTAVAEVARRSPVPIATGESFHTLGEFAELAAAGGVAYWQPEAAHLGGLGPLKAVAALAEAHDGVLAPHQAGGPVATAVCLTLAACTNHHVIQEHFDSFNEPWERDLVSWTPELDDDGCLPVPTAPGIGLELDVDAAREHPYHQQNFLPIFEDGWERRRDA